MSQAERRAVEWEVGSSGDTLRSGIAESYSRPAFGVLKLLHADLHSGSSVCNPTNNARQSRFRTSVHNENTN